MIFQPHNSGGLSSSISPCSWWVPEHPFLCSGGIFGIFGDKYPQGCLMGICLGERLDFGISESTCGLSSSFHLRLDLMTSEVFSILNDSQTLPPQFWLEMKTCSAHQGISCIQAARVAAFYFCVRSEFPKYWEGWEHQGNRCCAGDLGWESRRGRGSEDAAGVGGVCVHLVER